MILLRKLITTAITAELLLDPTNYREASFKGLAKGIFNYLNAQKYLLGLPVYPTTGIIASIPPIPGSALVGGSIKVQSYDILYQKLLKYCQSGTLTSNSVSHIGMFRAIQEYLEGHLITLKSTGVPITGATGTGLIRFPVMGLLGIPCWATMVAMGTAGLLNKDSTTEVLDKQYEILSNFIFIGLNYNMIPPIVTTGTIGSAYSGLSFLFWIFIDVPDWPVNTFEGLSSILSSLGLDSIDVSYDPEEEDSSLDSCGISFEDTYECPTGCSTLTEELLTSAFTSSANTSPYSSTGGSLCSQVNTINESTITSGLTSAATMSASFVGALEISYPEISLGTVEARYIDTYIGILKPYIKIGRTETVIPEKKNLLRTGKI